MIDPEIFVEQGEIRAAVSGLKVGDAIIELTPRESTDHADRLSHLGLPAVFGCVDGVSSRTEEEPSVTLWSTLFIGPYRELSAFDARTFTPSDISSIAIVKGEIYVPEASNGRFELGQQVITEIDGKETEVTIEGYFDGLVAIRSDDGQRGAGGTSFFKPITPEK